MTQHTRGLVITFVRGSERHAHVFVVHDLASHFVRNLASQLLIFEMLLRVSDFLLSRAYHRVTVGSGCRASKLWLMDQVLGLLAVNAFNAKTRISEYGQNKLRIISKSLSCQAPSWLIVMKRCGRV